MTKKTKFYRVEDGYDAVDLLKYAIDHRDAAYHLFKAALEFHDSAAYLAHLALEVLLKAMLLHYTHEFPGGHDLLELRDELKRRGSDAGASAEFESALFQLNQAWDIRYPTPRTPKSVGHSDRDALRLVWGGISADITSSLESAFESSPANEKGGRVLMVRRASLPDRIEHPERGGEST
jgi:HEPN domain-containing protein